MVGGRHSPRSSSPLATALVVYETGRRFLSPRAGLIAALVTTLNPYLVWHDVHVNREILDELLAAVVVYLTLLATERTGRRGLAIPALLGLALGLAILGNSRLVLLPLVVAVFVGWRLRRFAPALIVVGVCALSSSRGSCGTRSTSAASRSRRMPGRCGRRTTSSTYDVLDRGGWIDDVPNLTGAPPWPELAADLTQSGTPTTVDECAQMRLYRRQVVDFWRDHPHEKGRLAVQAARMLWDPRSIRTEGRAEAGGFVDDARTWVQPLYTIPLYVLALLGLCVLPRRIAALFLALLAYNTLAALVFAGATRYRVAVGLPARVGCGRSVVWLLERWRPREPACA